MRGSMNGFTLFTNLEKEMNQLKFKERHPKFRSNGRQIRMRERGRNWVCFYQKDHGTEKLEPLVDLLTPLYDDTRHHFVDADEITYTQAAYDTLHAINQQYPLFDKKPHSFSPNWIGYLAFQLGLGDEFVKENSNKKTKGFVRKIGTRGLVTQHDYPAVMIQCETPNDSLHELWDAIANAMGLEMVETYVVPGQRKYVNTDATGRYFKMCYHLTGDGIGPNTNGISFNNMRDLIDFLQGRFEDGPIENYTPQHALLQDGGNLKRSKRILELFEDLSTRLTLMEFYKLEHLKIYPYQLHD